LQPAFNFCVGILRNELSGVSADCVISFAVVFTTFWIVDFCGKAFIPPINATSNRIMYSISLRDLFDKGGKLPVEIVGYRSVLIGMVFSGKLPIGHFA
jgi:hypothetical protein